jgi:hypothetical protein
LVVALEALPAVTSGRACGCEQVRNQRDHGKDQQQMNKKSGNVKEDEAAYPQ